MGFVFGAPPPTPLCRIFSTDHPNPTGSVNIMRYGAGPNGIMRTLGQYMAGSGATFGYAQPYLHYDKANRAQLLHVHR